MKLLVAVLALAMCPLPAQPQQNIPTRESSREAREQDAPRRRNADAARLERADEMLDLALEALGGDPEASARDTLADTISTKAERVARMLIDLCMRVACTVESTDDGGE